MILNGGGSDKQVAESYRLFANLSGKGKIMYIPLAWYNGSYEDCLSFLSEQLKPYGITDIDLITDANQITTERLGKAAGIFIGGGNTFKLLKMLKDTSAFETLAKFVKNTDTVVMGGSAGALIWGKSIDSCKDDGLGLKYICDVNNVGLKDSSGFDFLNGYSLIVHYKKVEEQNALTEKRIKRLLKQGYKLICLPEETSLYLDNGTVTFIGTKPAEKIESENKRTIYNPRDNSTI